MGGSEGVLEPSRARPEASGGVLGRFGRDLGRSEAEKLENFGFVVVVGGSKAIFADSFEDRSDFRRIEGARAPKTPRPLAKTFR